ncbi:MAG TPA: hypothetical protein VF723_15560 [Pyrinomonadaceae bacterium]|jgi:hypothetical protein
MSRKKDQHKAGIAETPRGQEMGRGDDQDQNREAMKDTPALRGRRKKESRMFADESSQHMGADAATPRSNTPSIPAAAPTGQPLGQTGGERVFKERNKGKGQGRK